MRTGRLLGEVDPGHARKIISLRWPGKVLVLHQINRSRWLGLKRSGVFC